MKIVLAGARLPLLFDTAADGSSGPARTGPAHRAHQSVRYARRGMADEAASASQLRPGATRASARREGPRPVSGVRTIAPSSKRVRLRDLRSALPASWVLAQRDFKVLYKQSALGPLWLAIQPLGVLGAFTVVFSGVADIETGGVPYPLFALVGISVWTFLSACLATGTRCFTRSKRLIRLTNAPRPALAIAAVTAALPQLAVPVALTLIAVLAFGEGLGLELLALPLVALWLYGLTLAVVLALGALNVRFRDVVSLVPFLLQGGLFLSPIAYPLSEVPNGLDTILKLNPITGVVEAWRWSMLGSPADGFALAAAGAGTVAIAFIAWVVFVRLEVRFADVI
jgi:lipopolysaccharide transport system permease protein